MNKRNSLAILILSSVFVLASCGGMPVPPETSKQSSASTQTSQTSKDSKESKESKESSQPSAPSTPSEPSQPTSEPSEPSTPSEPTTLYTVTFETNGGTEIGPVQVAKGEPLTRPTDPEKLGFDFAGWYEDIALTMAYDFNEPVMASFTLYADWTPVQQSSDPSTEPETRTIYFKDAAWWNDWGPETYVSFTEIDPTTATEFGTMAHWISYDEVEKFNYWSIQVPEDAGGLMFIRVRFEETDVEKENPIYGDSCTAFLTIPEDKDMYVLDGDTWSNLAQGHWAVYGEEPAPTSNDSSGTSTPTGQDPYGPDGATKSDWYLVGEGANFHGWNFDGGLQLWTNPDNANDKGCALNVYFAVGDLFKVTDGNTWFGYEGVVTWDDPSNAGIHCFEGADDGYNGQNFSCTVAGYYDVYVNESGNFWIQVHA